MPETTFRGRRAAVIENSEIRVTALAEGGHIAEMFHKVSGVNPLWIPAWPSIEPSGYDPQRHSEYGAGADARLLAGIMGHNLCLDIFGGPSPEEADAGMTPHGEGSVVRYSIGNTNGEVVMTAHLPLAQLHFERRIGLFHHAVRIRETVENLSALDRPIAWTQHVTLGPPFLENGATQFRTSATRSKVFEKEFGSAAYLKTAAEFDWPMAPRRNGGFADLRVFNSDPVSSAYTAHLMDRQSEHAFFAAYSPAFQLAFGYVWQRADFPWMGIWEENHSRSEPPWNGGALTRGMEFGVSPMPESRREMVERDKLFGIPAYRLLPAKAHVEVEYWALAWTADSVPETMSPFAPI